MNDFTSAFRGHAFISAAAMLMIVSEHRDKGNEEESSYLFHVSHKAVKHCRHYCNISIRHV